MHSGLEDFVSTDATGQVIIYLPSGPTPISDTAKQIFSLMARDNRAFYRGGRVHEVAADSDGRLRLDVLLPEALRSRIEKLGTTMAYIKNQNGEYNPSQKRPTYEDCKALLATTEARDLLRSIANVYASPVLVLNHGEPVTITKGYHAVAGGAFVCDGEAVPELDAKEAASQLADLLVDFRFVSESDRTRNLSTILSPALRFGGFISGNVPIHSNEADQSQTGKGYNLEVVASIYGERPALVTMKSAGVGGFDEALSQRLIDGRPFLQLDNLRGRLDSQFLEAVLTAPGAVGCRVPHKGEVYVDPCRFFFSATSNGFEATRDLANRSCIIRLRKQPEGYPFKRWPEGSLVEHVQANQLHYLGCIHSIIKAWWTAGAQRGDSGGHDFRAWAQTVEGVIRFAWPDSSPMFEGHRTAQERTANPALVFLRQLCLAVEVDERTETPLTASALVEICETHGIEIPGLRDPTNEASAKKQMGMILARCLKSDRLMMDEYEVVRTVEDMQRTDGTGYYPSKRYEFRRMNRPEAEPEPTPELSNHPWSVESEPDPVLPL